VNWDRITGIALLFFLMHTFLATLFLVLHMSAIDDDCSTICTRNDMIHMQNGMLTIWLYFKVYCQCIGGFLRLLQHFEGHDVEKT